MAEEGVIKEEEVKDITILMPVGITTMEHEKGITAYQFIGQDEKEKKYIMTFLVKSFYRDTIDKYLKKLIPVHISKPEEKTDG